MAVPNYSCYEHCLLLPLFCLPFFSTILSAHINLSLLMTTQGFVDSVDQDQTAQNLQSDLCSALCTFSICDNNYIVSSSCNGSVFLAIENVKLQFIYSVVKELKTHFISGGIFNLSFTDTLYFQITTTPNSYHFIKSEGLVDISNFENVKFFEDVTETVLHQSCLTLNLDLIILCFNPFPHNETF